MGFGAKKDLVMVVTQTRMGSNYHIMHSHILLIYDLSQSNTRSIEISESGADADKTIIILIMSNG
jgi:hypothetical protein